MSRLTSARLAPTAGPRLLFVLWGDVFAEVDYAFVPDYLTSSPHGMLTRSHSSSVFGFVEWRIPQ